MYIHLSQEDIRPLYQQIADQIKVQIMDGTIAPGQELPSIRQLAQQLLTSVITVKRAYDDLEREGYIYTRQGLGTFAARISAPQLDDMRHKQAEEILSEAVEKCRALGLKGEEILGLIKELFKEDKG
ncbi:GntR family transcriptional regulator [Mahella australiensis]|jgi:GntR family transcriptional regulator|uniref:Transcriptional regulator, GntR family n=1 Tax=Mahella australiensis (strain DSM 15567 / CIP 107919 / 50-1 BON) TaxID=697281 RepID=F3ZW80_MAHA5|nr:GntR family transcriptional regulator [Mahella australiensis]AEE97489.1 transcriptional regulator, GntR family [Mahella australiensis 50-1 BON]